MKHKAMPHEEAHPAHSGSISVAALCRTVKVAEPAFEAMVEAGAHSAEVSVLARGLDVERHLIEDKEMNANQVASMGEDPFRAFALSRRLSSARLLLLDGCWATGPIFESLACRAGSQAPFAMVDALTASGLSKRETQHVVTTINTRGGVWLGLSGSAVSAETVARALRAIEGVEVWTGDERSQ